MNCARMALLALTVVLVGTAFLASPQSSGQVPAEKAGIPSPDDPSLGSPAARPQTDMPRAGYAAWSTARFTGGDPELQKLLESEALVEGEASQLLSQYSKTDDEGKRDKIKQQLTTVLGKQFDAQQKRRELEVARIEAQLKKLRELMRKRSDARKTIIDKRLDQVLSEAEGLGWTSPANGGQPRFYSPYQPAAK